MSVGGFKKQLNKASQFLGEKIGGVKGTELDESFHENEKKVDIMSKLIDEITAKSLDYLQPNPVTRSKLATMQTFDKIKGVRKDQIYPQPEGQLGDCMQKYGQELGHESLFGLALIDCGDTYKHLAEIKDALEDSTKQDFLTPLHGLKSGEITQINFHRKKTESRRLDFDCKKRKGDKGGKVPENEIKDAEDKFTESQDRAQQAMLQFLHNSEDEHIGALKGFVEAEIKYHTQAVEYLKELKVNLESKLNEASSRPPVELKHSYGSTSQISASNRTSSMASSNSNFDTNDSLYNPDNSPKTQPSSNTKIIRKTAHEDQRIKQVPTCRALYDFEAQEARELEFKEGDIVKLLDQIDDNWFFGEFKGKEGYFPVNFVEVIVPLESSTHKPT